MITGGLENQAEGYSALIPFVLHDAASGAPVSVTLASAGIMVGHPDPAMKFPNGLRFYRLSAQRFLVAHEWIGRYTTLWLAEAASE